MNGDKMMKTVMAVLLFAAMPLTAGAQKKVDVSARTYWDFKRGEYFCGALGLKVDAMYKIVPQWKIGGGLGIEYMDCLSYGKKTHPAVYANSIVSQGFTNGWGNINFAQAAFSGFVDGMIAQATLNFSTYVSKPVSSLTENIKSPLLRSFVANEMIGIPSGAFMGGVMAVIDNNPETSFWGGVWNGIKTAAFTSGISSIQPAAVYARQNNKNILTGVDNVNYEIQRKATEFGIKSGQKGLNQEIMNEYYKQMQDQTFDKNGISGYYHDGKYTITDGNHRLAAAIKYYINTGNSTYLNNLLNSPRIENTNPLNYGYHSYKFPIAR